MSTGRFEALETARLTIRRFRDEDAEALAAYRDDPRVARYQGWERPYSVAQARAFIAALRDGDAGRPGAWFQLAVSPRGETTLLGDVGLRVLPEPRREEGELGFSFAVAHQGQGHATEAVAAVAAHAFESLGMRRLFAITDRRNLPAQRLLTRVGFIRARELPEGELLFERHAGG